MGAAAELGRNPASKHQVKPQYRDEQADAGRDCQTRLARPNSQARTRTGTLIFPVQLTTCRIGRPYQFDPTLAMCVTVHTYYRVICIMYIIYRISVTLTSDHITALSNLCILYTSSLYCRAITNNSGVSVYY